MERNEWPRSSGICSGQRDAGKKASFVGFLAVIGQNDFVEGIVGTTRRARRFGSALYGNRL